MLRRSYQGIGKRGIGVGYPAQVNMAFDAEQLRWGLLWRGRFADPGGVWRGQGHGTVRPLSREVVRFTAGPDLDDAESPWTSTAGRPARHRFRGYTLDDRQRPRFRYEFDGIAVQDYAIDRKDTQTQQPVLRRTIRLQSSQGRPGTVFRVASGKKIQAAGDRQFLIDGRLRVRIGADYPARIVTTSTDTQLQIPLDVPGGTTTLVMEYTW